MFEVLKYVEFLPFSCECGFWRVFWVSVVLLDFLFVWFGFWVYFFPKRGEKNPNRKSSSYILQCCKNFQNMPFKTNSNNSSLKFKTKEKELKTHKKLPKHKFLNQNSPFSSSLLIYPNQGIKMNNFLLFAPI